MITPRQKSVLNSDFIFKAFRLFVSMDKMVGRQFEEELATIKVNEETSPKPYR